ncbi:hypothetical protein D3C81_2316930 [compost metagenome]
MAETALHHFFRQAHELCQQADAAGLVAAGKRFGLANFVQQLPDKGTMGFDVGA